MQTDQSRVWTQVTVFLSYDGNSYTTSASDLQAHKREWINSSVHYYGREILFAAYLSYWYFLIDPIFIKMESIL